MSAASSSSSRLDAMLSIEDDDALDGWRTDDKPPTTYTWWWLLTLTYSYEFLRTLTSPKMAGGMFGDNNNGGKKIWRSNFEL